MQTGLETEPEQRALEQCRELYVRRSRPVPINQWGAGKIKLKNTGINRIAEGYQPYTCGLKLKAER